MDYDIVIVGAGPAGLSAACRLKQVNPDLSVVVLEKGSEVGAHILSGAVMEPTALNELFPDWKTLGAPLITEVRQDNIYVFNKTRGIKVPSLFVPKTMHNTGNYIVSLGNVCRWLAEQAEQLGVEIFPGFAAAEVLYDDNNNVRGVVTGDMGVAADGSHKADYTPGMELRGKYTFFAEGCRGHLGKQLIEQFSLDENSLQPQHYGIGIKELWQIPPEKHHQGLVVHSAGWPLSETGSSGGGFLYHMEDNLVAVGLTIDLSYSNPHLSPFDEFQRYKQHPVIRQYLEGGERVSYGARALVKGGMQSLPKMTFNGGVLLGDNAGTLNFAKIKGIHCAMKTGMIAAESAAEAIANNRQQDELTAFNSSYQSSWAYQELHRHRNFGPAQHKWGNIIGSAYAFIDINIFNGHLPWTLTDPRPDHTRLKPASESKSIDYPKPDNRLTFDKLSSVFISNTNHEEAQPCHLKLKNPDVPISHNLPLYDEPAQRYCPAGVYEVVDAPEGGKRFQINAQNCVHCKTCDIKDPSQNIIWVAPEGGGGPSYPNM
ncbi:electron transfer flavoprotein-ubiquinone oxidoreductase [uncultured Porticoccus sp.]|uniref:electron transfer flavoprotein-ubiquinone oxidoreductase n=1 Tax=uncultured Porticoccus sp. TaxID=1256050 RepID=UPI002626214E|nr:electron transfer flavoprotein-ubiquinone oxidoreductase [uncultured Porticoccus sp.]